MASVRTSRSGDESSNGTHETVNLHRRFGNCQIQFMAVGASIGTALFVGIGQGLRDGGPGSLLLAFILYSCLLAPVNNCAAEMAIYMPIPGSFVRYAGKWVDPAFGIMAGWIFFFYEACLIPFEVSALNGVLGNWNNKIPIYAVCLSCMFLWTPLNLVVPKYFGKAEIGLSSAKIVLILMLFCFTFVTMAGGNPQHDSFGFRFWNGPGAFAEHLGQGPLGRFFGFLSCLRVASLTIAGPEYISMIAAEAQRPRTYLKTAFKTIYARFVVVFIACALFVGIVLPSNDAALKTSVTSPFVLAMNNLKIGVLPHLVNSLLATSIFSAGNGYVFCASRSLHSMAIEGHAPRFLSKCTKQGIPYYAFFITMLFPLISLAQLDKSNSAEQLVGWLGDVTATAQLINYFVISVVFIFFYRALKTQGKPRSSLPYIGWCQPLCGWIGAVSMVVIVLIYGYKLIIPGQTWSNIDFLTSYTMPILALFIYSGAKFKVVWSKNSFTGLSIRTRTQVVAADEADLVWEAPSIDEYEDSLVDPATNFKDEVLGRKTGHRSESSLDSIIGTSGSSTEATTIRRRSSTPPMSENCTLQSPTPAHIV